MIGRFFRIGTLLGVFMLVAGISTYVTLTFFIKSTDKVVVPSLTGKHVVPTLEILSDLSLNTKVLRIEYHNEIPRHHVIFQEPEAGIELKKGRDVRIVISKGKMDVLTPNLTGLSVHQARLIIEQNGLCNGRHSTVYSGEYGIDVVMAQSPAAGTITERGQCVDFLISKGTRPRAYMMPDLTGMSLADAIDLLENHHLRIGRMTAENTRSHPPDVIVGQEPLPGHRVEAETPVNMVVNHAGGDEGTVSVGNRDLHLFRYRLENGFLNQHVRLRLNSHGLSVDLFDDFAKPGRELWFFIPKTGNTSFFLYQEDELIKSKVFH